MVHHWQSATSWNGSVLFSSFSSIWFCPIQVWLFFVYQRILIFFVALLVYVDDIIITDPNTQLIQFLKTFLHTQFKLKDLGCLKLCNLPQVLCYLKGITRFNSLKALGIFLVSWHLLLWNLRFSSVLNLGYLTCKLFITFLSPF